MRVAYGVVIAIIVVMIGCSSDPSSASARTLVVRGSATVHVEPDRVSFSVGVDAQDPSVSPAFDKAAASLSAVISALKDSGVSAHEIQTSRMNITEVRTRDNKLLGYKASSRITVTRASLDDVGDLLQAAVDAGVNQIDGLRFFVADVSGVTDEGLQRAYEDARRKAEKLASLSGSALGRVISISDGTSWDTQKLGSLVSLGYVGGAFVSPGTEELTLDVVVEFELEGPDV